MSYADDSGSTTSSAPGGGPADVAPVATTSTALQQHQQEQEMLQGYAVPNPPVLTQQSSLATEKEPGHHGDAPRTLWMGDLDPWLDENGIIDLWWHVLGKRVCVKVIKPRIPLKTDGTFQGHLGYCFVEFESFEDAQQALTLNGQLLPDMAMPSQQLFPNNPDNQKKYYRLNWALGATLLAPIIQSPEYSLFVGDLSALTTEAHLLALFQKSFPHSIKTVRVMTDPVLGKSRCFGFVRFTDELERQRALLEMNGVWFGGRPLRVALATPRNQIKPPQYPPQGPPQPPTSQAPHRQSRSHYSTRDMMYNSYNYSAPPPQWSEPKQLSSPGQPYVDPNNTTVFVGGLSLEVTEATLYALFQPYGTIEQVKIPPGKNCGFIKYMAREEAEEAILRMQGFIIGGNRVRLLWGRVSLLNKKFQHQQHQVAQAAQIQAAAALSMGMDPATAIAAAAAAAAGGYPHHMGPIAPPMAGLHSQPHYMHDPMGSYGLFREKDFGLDELSLVHQMGSMHLHDDIRNMGPQPQLYMLPMHSRKDKRDRK